MSTQPHRPIDTLHDVRLRWAVALAVLVHGGLLIAGSYRGTYDAWVHIFFGDHYARDWFSTWEPRWYTGFTVTSYPPAAHQSVGLLSKAVGLETGFVIVQMAAVVNVVIGVYRFSLLWVSRSAAGWAALLAVVSSSIAEVVHTFGQLPTTLALGFLLNAQPSIRRWVWRGARVDLVAAVALLAATTAGHHVTTLFGTVFFTGPVVVRALFDRLSTPVPGEPVGHLRHTDRASIWPVAARRLRRVFPALLRAAVLAVLTVLTLIVTVLPYWLWSSSDPIIQVPIPHASRNNFLSDTAAGLVFFVVPWISLLLVAPIALVQAVTTKGWPLGASISLLALLGTGGTTPIPRALLGGAFDILTLDRFTIWATIAILPFCGWVVTSIRTGAVRTILRSRLGEHAPQALLGAIVVCAIVGSVFASTLTTHRPFQPREIDPEPIAAFMDKDQHDRWRYLTLGFGDQMAWVSANTTALTVDGNYHSVRRLPELTTRAVERLEGAKFRGVPGIGSLQQFLVNPSPYHLKFVFSIDRFYDPLLWASGWQRIGLLDNDVEVWERADVAPMPDVLPVSEIPTWQRVLWGTLPMSALAGGVVTMIWLAFGKRRRFAADRRDVGRLLGPIDRRLGHAASALAARSDLVVDRTPWSTIAERRRKVVDRLAAPASPARRRIVVIVVALAAAGAIGVAWNQRTTAESPEQTIEAYYDALDFQRFGDAHARLDPVSRPDLAQYLLDVSLRDGLLAGYAELDSVNTTITNVPVVDDDADVVVDAVVDLVFITSVEEYRVERQHRLVRRSGAWFIEPDVPSILAPVDQLVIRPGVDVATLGRAVATTATTSFDDILDRPRLALGPATTYREGQRWIVIGTVTNVDVDPADVTVNAVLRDVDGTALSRYDAGVWTVHQVLPGETVSYRVDLEARAGSFDRDDSAAGDFDPLAYAEPVLDAEVAAVEIASRAVVTGGQLERVVDLIDATAVASADDALELRATLRNTGVISATVARISVTYLDDVGDAVWTDLHWVPETVRPQRSIEVAWSSTVPDLDVVEVDTATFDNNKVGGAEGAADQSFLRLPIEGGLEIAGRPVTSVALTVTSFQRQVEP